MRDGKMFSYQNFRHKQLLRLYFSFYEPGIFSRFNSRCVAHLCGLFLIGFSKTAHASDTDYTIKPVNTSVKN